MTRDELQVEIVRLCGAMPATIAEAEAEGNVIDAKIFLDIQRHLTEIRLKLGCITPAPKRVRTCGFARPNITRRGTN